MLFAIFNREDVFFTEENQWCLRGYVFFESNVHSFYIDQKDQFGQVHWSRNIDKAIAVRPMKKGVRPWLRQIKKREENIRKDPS